MQDITIRSVDLGDAPQIAEIYNHYIEYTDISFETVPLTDSQMRQRIAALTGLPLTGSEGRPRPVSPDGVFPLTGSEGRPRPVSPDGGLPLTGSEGRPRPVSPDGEFFPYIVCERAGEILGYAYAHPWKERAAYRHTLETTVYIRKGYERRGLGRLLMQRLIHLCRERGAHALVACITGGNTSSVSLHTSLGFTRASLFPQVGYKHGRWLDVVDLILLL